MRPKKSIGLGLFLLMVGVLLSRMSMQSPEEVSFPEWLFGTTGIIISLYGGMMTVDMIGRWVVDLFNKNKKED